jgi:hypothetical protein
MEMMKSISKINEKINNNNNNIINYSIHIISFILLYTSLCIILKPILIYLNFSIFLIELFESR